MRSERHVSGDRIAAVCGALLGILLAAPMAIGQERKRTPHPPLPAAGSRLPSIRATPAATAVVNFRDMVARDRAKPPYTGPPIMIAIPEPEAPAEPEVDVSGLVAPQIPLEADQIQIASPAASNSFPGLEDGPKVGIGGIVIPPDVDGAVGRTRILETLNNNYRVLNKSNGADLGTVAIDTFWSPLAPGGAAGFFDPKTVYDPYNDRWIVTAVSNAETANSSVLVGVSQTDDPMGLYYLARYDADAANNNWADFPCIGFNKNWVAVNVNMFTNVGGSYVSSKMLVVDYPQMRSGTFVATIFTNSTFCTSPAHTYSATENTLYAPTHLNAGSGTYRLDTITGTPAAPIYNPGVTRMRGLTWFQPGGNQAPQAAPLFGASACGATPCKIDVGDTFLRTGSVFRNGSIYYVQTVRLGATSTSRTGIQWTVLNAATGNVTDGGRLEDPTATQTNGGKWYSYPCIAVNAAGDFLLSFTQTSSAQYATCGYALHLASDGPGTLRDAFPFKFGEDYYHKDFGTNRNRWGDYTKAQVDPIDDMSLWALSEYAKMRVGTDDGTTGANASRWATWWAVVGGPPPTVSILPGPSVPEGDAGTTPATFTIQLSAAYSAPVNVGFAVHDGTATQANNDYQVSFSSVTIPAGSTSAPVSVSVVGDLNSEQDETFTVELTSAINGVVGAPNIATGTILNDDDAAPSVTVTHPNGGETLATSGLANLTWSATDDFAVTAVDIRLSRAGSGGPFEDIALSQANTGSYSWTVTGPPTTDAWLKVTAHDAAAHTADDLSDQAWTIIDGGAVAVGGETPGEFALRAIRPNPTTGRTTIFFDLARAADVRLSVVDLQGRRVATLVDGARPAGRHSALWGGTGAGGPARAGLYFVFYEFPGKTEVKRLLITR